MTFHMVIDVSEGEPHNDWQDKNQRTGKIFLKEKEYKGAKALHVFCGGNSSSEN
jgi:hypothetical protein